jgi:hypothetical protein
MLERQMPAAKRNASIFASPLPVGINVPTRGFGGNSPGVDVPPVVRAIGWIGPSGRDMTQLVRFQPRVDAQQPEFQA